MSKTVLYIAMSLDGYIATKDDDVSWLIGENNEIDTLENYNKFYNSISDIIMGYNTYYTVRTKLSPQEWVYKDKKCYVVTNKELHSTKDITFTKNSLLELTQELKNTASKDIWICGGGSVATQMIENDLIDEYKISIAPTILGDGIKLFNYITEEKKLKLQSIIDYNGIVELTYIRR